MFVGRTIEDLKTVLNLVWRKDRRGSKDPSGPQDRRGSKDRRGPQDRAKVKTPLEVAEAQASREASRIASESLGHQLYCLKCGERIKEVLKTPEDPQSEIYVHDLEDEAKGFGLDQDHQATSELNAESK